RTLPWVPGSSNRRADRPFRPGCMPRQHVSKSAPNHRFSANLRTGGSASPRFAVDSSLLSRTLQRARKYVNDGDCSLANSLASTVLRCRGGGLAIAGRHQILLDLGTL